jgi:hypothetical protein
VELFFKTQEVRDLVKANGPSVLPVTMIDGKIYKKQKYPVYAELEQWLKA